LVKDASFFVQILRNLIGFGYSEGQGRFTGYVPPSEMLELPIRKVTVG